MIITNKGMVLTEGVVYFESTPKLVSGVLDISSSPTTNATSAILTKVELYDGETLLDTCTCHDRLMSMSLERAGQTGKFFGFGVIHKLTLELLDLEENLNLVKGNIFKVYAGYSDDNMIKPYPTFYVHDFTKDQDNGVITVTCYDAIFAANDFTTEDVRMLFFEEVETEEGIAELKEVVSYSVRGFLEQGVTNFMPQIVGIEIVGLGSAETCFDTYYYPDGANFDGTEAFKYALDSIAEVTQTIYYVNNEDKLVFKRPDINGAAVLTIGEDTKISLVSGEPIILASVANVTELGDNIGVDAEGTIQYVRNNPFWEMREDIYDLVVNATAAVSGMQNTPFLCDWLGNFLLEIGDKIDIVATGSNIISAYLFNDIIRFNGALIETTQWTYEAQEETHTNPTSLGEVINQTIAKVDKVNKEITLMVANTEKNTQNIAQLKITDNEILASVSGVESNINDKLEGVNEDIATLKEEVSLRLTKSAVQAEIKQEIETNGVNSVKTTTGTFNKEGLVLNSTGALTSTNLNTGGMVIYEGEIKLDENGKTILDENGEIPNEKILEVNSDGVEAKNLHANEFLIIGSNTYFSDYTAEDGEARAGCFWTGR